MKSIKGRPRIVTDAQVEAILAWHRTSKSLRQVAQEMGLSPSFVQYVIARGGEYKQVSPELREETRKARAERFKALAAGGWL